MRPLLSRHLTIKAHGARSQSVRFVAVTLDRALGDLRHVSRLRRIDLQVVEDVALESVHCRGIFRASTVRFESMIVAVVTLELRYGGRDFL